jgi:hypothetical protein
MKRIAILALMMFSIAAANAQEAVVLLNYAVMEKKYLKSEADSKDPKKSANPTTWFNRGKLMQDIYTIDLQYIQEGVDKTMLKLYYKEPKSTRIEGSGADAAEVLVYDRIEYYFVNGLLARWNKTKTIVPDPLHLALDSYQKTLELDTKGSLQKKLTEQLSLLKQQFKQNGINAYYSGNKAEAVLDFEKVLVINEMPMFAGEVDTVMIQYSAIIAREMNDFATAAKYYEQLAEMGWGGPNTYLNIKSDYIMLADTVSAITTMEKAFEVFPDTVAIVANLVDLYIRTGKIEQGLAKVDAAIASNPDKGELYYWKGRLMINLENDESSIDKAIEAYKTSLAKNETLYYSYYDLGFIYFLQGQDFFSQAGLEKDLKRRAQINEIATEKYQESIPLLENAVKYNDNNADLLRETYDTLKRVYYKLEMTDKYNEVNEKLKGL